MNMDHPRRAVNMPTTYLKAAAGGAGGSWYVLMEGLGRLVAEIYPRLRIEVVEGGGVANHARVGAGELPMGILNPPMTAAAMAGSAARWDLWHRRAGRPDGRHGYVLRLPCQRAV
jgi:TRAP-type uncharacterized transport system substrate-binding protein